MRKICQAVLNLFLFLYTFSVQKYLLLQINKMSLDDKSPLDPLRFILIDKNPGSDLKLLCQTLNEDVQHTWLETIRSLLDMQGDFLRGIGTLFLYNNLNVWLLVKM